MSKTHIATQAERAIRHAKASKSQRERQSRDRQARSLCGALDRLVESLEAMELGVMRTGMEQAADQTRELLRKVSH